MRMGSALESLDFVGAEQAIGPHQQHRDQHDEGGQQLVFAAQVGPGQRFDQADEDAADERAQHAAEPTQASENTRGTLMPTEYAAAWSLAVARRATQPRQKRNTTSTAAMNTTAINAPQNTLGARNASPTMMGCVGMKSGRRRWSAVQIISTRPTSTEARPTATMKTER